MNAPEIAAASLVALAALFACVRARGDAEHRPLALALSVAALEPLRPDDGALARLLALALPALSSWLAVRVLDGRRAAALVVGAAVLVVGAYARWRLDSTPSALVWASIASVLVQAVVVALRARRHPGLPARCVYVLLAGDVAALAGPLADGGPSWALALRWWLVQWQAAGVAAVLCAMHVTAPRVARSPHRRTR